MKKITILLILTFTMMISAGSVSAQKMVFQDDFNDNNFDDWAVVRNAQWQENSLPCMYNDQPAEWEIIDGELGININGPACVTEIIPKSFTLTGISNFKYSFDWYFKETIASDRNVIFYWQDKKNWYDFKITNNQILLQKVINGVSLYVENAKGAYPFENNKRYHISIVVNDNHISLIINDSVVIDVIDVEPKILGNKTVGLQASVGAISNSKSFFDNIAVYDLDQPETPIMPLYKQSDPIWGNQEYDSASKWTNNTGIKRWGCALTSMAMILRGHGINIIPTGEALNPGTLNTWLKNQSDGYWSNGSLNWLAVTRLTKLVSKILGTPSLEYTKLGSNNWLANSIINIENGKPVILEIPGHFLVADGVNSNKNDLLIKDPAYKYTYFSQHQSDAISVRLFTPSFTDLSYIALAIDSKSVLKIISPAGKVIEAVGNEYLQAQEEDGQKGPKTPMLKIIELPKPELGEYKLIYTQPKFGKFSIKILAYDQNGEVQNLSVSGVAGKMPITYKLNYTNDGFSAVKRTCTFLSLRELIRELIRQRELKHPLFLTWLEYVAARTPECRAANKTKCTKLVRQAVHSIKRYMTPMAQEAIEQELSHME